MEENKDKVVEETKQENVTKVNLKKEIDNVTKVDLTKKPETDAVQKQSTDEVPVRDESETSGEVQEENEKVVEEITGEDKEKVSEEVSNEQPVIEEITDENFFVDYKGLYKKENSENKNLKFNSLDDIVSTTIGYKIKHCILKLKNDNNFLSKVALSKNLLDIVGNYLNSKEIVCKIECFITNPFESTEYEKKKEDKKIIK